MNWPVAVLMNIIDTTDFKLIMNIIYVWHYSHFKGGIINLSFYKWGLIGEGGLSERGLEREMIVVRTITTRVFPEGVMIIQKPTHNL